VQVGLAIRQRRNPREVGESHRVAERGNVIPDQPVPRGIIAWRRFDWNSVRGIVRKADAKTVGLNVAIALTGSHHVLFRDDERQQFSIWTIGRDGYEKLMPSAEKVRPAADSPYFLVLSRPMS